MPHRILSAKGVALVELALLVPALLLLLFGGIELTRALYTRTALVGFAREVGMYAFRTSLDLPATTATEKLQRAIDETWALFEREFPQGSIRLRLVKYGSRPSTATPGTTVIWNRVAEVTRHASGVNEAERPSRLGTIDASGNSAVMDQYFRTTTPAEIPRRDLLLQNQDFVLLAEFYYPYRSIVPGLASSFGFSGNMLYVRIEY